MKYKTFTYKSQTSKYQKISETNNMHQNMYNTFFVILKRNYLFNFFFFLNNVTSEILLI